MLTFANGNCLFSFGNIQQPQRLHLGSPAPAISRQVRPARGHHGASRALVGREDGRLRGRTTQPGTNGPGVVFQPVRPPDRPPAGVGRLAARSGTVGFPLICLTADGTKLIAANPDGTLTVRDLATNKEIARSKWPSRRCGAWTFRRMGRSLPSAGKPRSMCGPGPLAGPRPNCHLRSSSLRWSSSRPTGSCWRSATSARPPSTSGTWNAERPAYPSSRSPAFPVQV